MLRSPLHGWASPYRPGDGKWWLQCATAMSQNQDQHCGTSKRWKFFSVTFLSGQATFIEHHREPWSKDSKPWFFATFPVNAVNRWRRAWRESSQQVTRIHQGALQSNPHQFTAGSVGWWSLEANLFAGNRDKTSIWPVCIDLKQPGHRQVEKEHIARMKTTQDICLVIGSNLNKTISKWFFWGSQTKGQQVICPFSTGWNPPAFGGHDELGSYGLDHAVLPQMQQQGAWQVMVGIYSIWRACSFSYKNGAPKKQPT